MVTHRSRGVVFIAALAAMTLLAFVPLATGQVAGTAAITGTVTDSSGAVVPDATVTVTSSVTAITRTVTTDSTGRYTVSQLPPAVYKVEVKKEGFKTASRPSINLPIGVTSTLDVSLDVGTQSQIVEVMAETAGVNTVDASIGTPLQGEQVRALPSLDLNPAGLLSLQAGVAFIPAQADNPGGYGGANDYDGRSGAVNGARSDQTNVTLDGIDCNDPITGYAFTCALRATSSSLAEFRTTTANYSADAGGRSSSAQVQLLTTSGTNKVHGNAYYAHRNEALNANDWFLNHAGLPEGKFRRHIYGASAGAPIWKDRLYVFGNYERLQESLFKSALRTVPGMSYRDGAFIYDCDDSDPACPSSPTTVAGLTGTWNVPAGHYGLTPAQIAAIDPLGIGPNMALVDPTNGYWRQYPTDINDTSVGDGLNALGHRFASPIDNKFNTYIGKLDFTLDSAGHHTFFARGTYHQDTIVTETQFEGSEPIRNIKGGSRGMAFGYTAVLSPTIVNNLRAGVTRIKVENIGIRSGEYANVRFMDELHGFDQTTPPTSTANRVTPTYHLRDDVSWNMGRHTFAFGADLRWVRNQKLSNALSFHGFTVNPSWLPDGGDSIVPGGGCTQPICSSIPSVASGSRMADFLTLLLGPITQVDASYNFDRSGRTLESGEPVGRRFAANEMEFYAQDQWRVTPSLTVTAGVRYMYSTPPWEQNGNQVVPNPGFGGWFNCREQNMKAGIPTSECGLIQTVLGGRTNGGDPYYTPDKNNFSPRLAAAWSPHFGDSGILGTIFGDGKMSIRGGYSLVYDRMGMALVNTYDEQGAFGMSSGITSQFGGCNIGPGAGRPACSRFAGPFNTDAPKTLIVENGETQLVPSPGASFPATPPEGLLTVSNGLDNTIRTPYAHMYDLSIGRELPWNMTIEGAYIGRRGRKVPLLRDYAMPADFCDPASGVCRFEAERQLVALAAQGQDINTLAPIPFWENLFPGFGPTGANGGCLGWEALGSGCGFSATQVAYDYIMGYHGVGGVRGFGASTAFQDFDYFQFPGYMNCPTGQDLDGDPYPDCPFAVYPAQYVNLFTWSTIARSEYHAFQATLRKRTSNGISFTVNYTLSKSLDHASTPERQDPTGFFTGGYTGTAINSWEIDREYSYSDYDMRHSLNSYYLVELPFGKGRHFGSGWNGALNQAFGGWQVAGIVRFNTGVPANVINGRTWPTNWNLQGNAECAPAGAYKLGLETAPCPATQNAHFAQHGSSGETVPNMFADPDTAFTQFRFAAPGERGQRNVLRGDGYASFDLGIGKTFNMPYGESHKLGFRWDIFNLTNSAYFDTGSLNASLDDSSTFGDYTAVLGGPRRMQVSLRYEF